MATINKTDVLFFIKQCLMVRQRYGAAIKNGPTVYDPRSGQFTAGALASPANLLPAIT